MNAGDIIKEIMKAQNIKQSDMRKALELNSDAVVAMRLKQKNMSIKILCEMLEVLDYEVVIKPKVRCKKRVYKITKY